MLFGRVLELVGSLPGDGVAVVALEDLHWADPLTWDLFDFLARNLVDERVVLVGTYRANEVSRERPATSPAGRAGPAAGRAPHPPRRTRS